ncbi:cache domain-containing sensor histidine kinase [Vallitalea guaymasensis]|uniref:cache domain-containing sensor histidine kinase n=1 Tax=Vallitalea guaymasensis TaxID=1185412 RepID=UPI00272D9C08|nr:sensor histidine kinase [Vallitalea guaymasensis]
MRKLISRFNRISIKNKLFILNALIIIISLIVFANYANKASTNAIIEKAEKSAIRELELINKNLMTTVNSFEDYTRIITSDYRLQEELLKLKKQDKYSSKNMLKKLNIEGVISAIISNIIAPNTQGAAIAVYDTEDIIYSGYNLFTSEVDRIITPTLLNRAIQEQIPVWSGLLTLEFGDKTKENVFAVEKLVIDKDTGYKTGVVIMFVNEKTLSQIYIEDKTNANDKILILDENDRIISSKDKEELHKDISQVFDMDKNEYNQLLQNGSIILSENNHKILYSIQNFKKLNWKLISSIPLNEITQENAQIGRIIITVGIMCVIFAFIASYLISYTITKPVQQLTGTMKDIMTGDIKIRAREYESGEIGILTKGFNNLMDKVESLIDEVYHEQRAKRKSEFRLLQVQIKPHFLYNTLETIISFIKLKMNDKAIVTTKNLANFYRVSLSKGNDIISIEDEIKLTKSYLSIQALRYAEYMDFEINVDDNILHYDIPKLILQPLVENSIYHGLKQKEDKGKLIIKGYEREDKIFIEVIDNGLGMTELQIEEVLNKKDDSARNKSFGLGSVNQRIQLFFGKDYGVKIESEYLEYTKVIISLPKQFRREE